MSGGQTQAKKMAGALVAIGLMFTPLAAVAMSAALPWSWGLVFGSVGVGFGAAALIVGVVAAINRYAHD